MRPRATTAVQRRRIAAAHAAAEDAHQAAVHRPRGLTEVAVARVLGLDVALLHADDCLQEAIAAGGRTSCLVVAVEALAGALRGALHDATEGGP